MGKRLFDVGALISVGVACAVVGWWCVAAHVDPRKQRWHLSEGVHVSVDSWGDWDGRLEVFNQSYGPYSGSIVLVSGPGVKAPKERALGDALGMYFRAVPLPTGGWWWTVSISLVYPLVGAVVWPGVWGWRRYRMRGVRGFAVDGVDDGVAESSFVGSGRGG